MLEVDKLKNDFPWLNMVRAGSRVSRFHLYPTIKPQTVGQHTYGLIGLLHHILGFGNVSAPLNAAAFSHDLSEGRNGDMPGNIKGDTALGRAMKEADRDFEREYGLEVNITYWEYDLLKLCDRLDCMLTVIEEMKMGNQMLNEIGDVLFHALSDWAALAPHLKEADTANDDLQEAFSKAAVLVWQTVSAYRELRRFD